MTTTQKKVESPTKRTNRSLLMDFGSAPGSESELTVETNRDRVDSTSEVLERILHQSVPPHRWGINE